jgi:hypothetical protein
VQFTIASSANDRKMAVKKCKRRRKERNMVVEVRKR